MEADEVSWERVVYEARKKPDDPIAKVFLETEQELDRWKDDYGEIAILLAKRDAELAATQEELQSEIDTRLKAWRELAALREAAEAVSEDAYACDILIDEPYVVSEKCMHKLRAALNKEGE